MKSALSFTLAVFIVFTGSVSTVIMPLKNVGTFSCADVTEIPQPECEALVALYNSTDGSQWNDNTGWLVSIRPSEWYGVSVASGRVTRIELWFNHLVGTIPSGLSNLTSLLALNLGDNQLTGNIPAELGKLTYLTYLDLYANQLTGSIPPELGNLTNLSVLYLYGNWLGGNIPPELGNLSKLSNLSLSSDMLSGSIPSELGNLSSLSTLELSGNKLSGSIPSELGNLTGLKILYLDGNQLVGDVPESLINLVNLCPSDCGENPPYGLSMDYNLLNVPCGYPDPNDPLQVFLSQKNPTWQFSQGIQEIIGVDGGELIAQDGRTDFLIPAGALITDTTFTFKQLPFPLNDHFGLAFIRNSFELTAVDSACNPVTAFNLPITITLTYMDADFGAIPEDSLGLYYWDISASIWTNAVTTCPEGVYIRTPDANSFSLPLCHLTEFGVFGTPLRIFMPLVHH